MFTAPTSTPAVTVNEKKTGERATDDGTPTGSTANGKARPISTPNPIIEAARLVNAFLEIRMNCLADWRGLAGAAPCGSVGDSIP